MASIQLMICEKQWLWSFYLTAPFFYQLNELLTLISFDVHIIFRTQTESLLLVVQTNGFKSFTVKIQILTNYNQKASERHTQTQYFYCQNIHERKARAHGNLQTFLSDFVSLFTNQI